MKCWDCEYFKIIQEPLRVGKDIYDLGRAECTNFDLVVDFINHGKLKRLECIDETMAEREQVMGIRQDQCNKVCRIIDDYLSNRPRERDELIVAVRTVFKEADRKTENSSEKPNNFEHITEDGVTCAKYPACDDCLDNPLNKVKGSERLVKGSEQTESTISKMEQVEPQTCSFSDCDNFKNPDYERCIECKRKQIKLKTEQTEPSEEEIREAIIDGCKRSAKFSKVISTSQTEQTDCDTCKYAQIADEHCEFCGEAYIDNYEPQTESYYTDATHFGKAKGESTTTNTADTPQTEDEIVLDPSFAELSVEQFVKAMKLIEPQTDCETRYCEDCKHYDDVNGHCFFIGRCTYEPKGAQTDCGWK